MLERYWTKYGRPVALTEVHMGCTREEQLRWLAEAWSGMQEAAANGVAVRAMCVWSLLGALRLEPAGHRRRRRLRVGRVRCAILTAAPDRALHRGQVARDNRRAAA